MRIKIIRVISVIFSLLVFTLLIKLFYFDTKLGYDNKVLGITYFSLPKCVNTLFITLTIPIVIYFIIYKILQKLISHRKTKDK